MRESGFSIVMRAPSWLTTWNLQRFMHRKQKQSKRHLLYLAINSQFLWILSSLWMCQLNLG